MNPTRRLALAAPALLLAPRLHAREDVAEQIMVRKLSRLDPPKGTDWPLGMILNFPQLMEQNFAHNPARVLDGLSDAELSAIAGIYTTSVAYQGRKARLLDLMAQRVSPDRLGRMSDHFGFGPVYEAVTRHAPQIANRFLEHARPDSPVPMHFGNPSKVGVRFFDGDARMIQVAAPRMIRVVEPYLNMTLYQIYLSFRTAPYGAAMSPAASLWTTGIMAYAALKTSWDVGWWIGTQVAGTVQAIAPGVYPAIGTFANNIVNPMSQATTPAQRGAAIGASARDDWKIPVADGRRLYDTGGDFGVTGDWGITDFNWDEWGKDPGAGFWCTSGWDCSER